MVGNKKIGKIYQCILAELLVPDHPGGLALPGLGLARCLDLVLAKSDLQVGHVVAGHTKKDYFQM